MYASSTLPLNRRDRALWCASLFPSRLAFVRTAARELVWGDNAVVWLVQSERARRTVPDAAVGVGWSNFGTVVDLVRRNVEKGPEPSSSDAGPAECRCTWPPSWPS